MEWMQYIPGILSGLAVCIPLVCKLVEYVRKSIREKNWSALVQLVLRLMQEAETKFDDGLTRREWVLAQVAASAELVQYDIDLNVVSDLIDSLCSMSKVVNTHNVIVSDVAEPSEV